ncbi:hypothetical protein EI94DRAFT_1721042 [Lactarius quietus]|nr:hypothetical protein EI94DRAFT_1721042 [Lactarius quietus]
MECPAYAHERWKLRPKKGNMETKYAEILASKKWTMVLAHFINATGRFTVAEQTNKETMCSSLTSTTRR